jgi:thymidylate synthase (FAD)
VALDSITPDAEVLMVRNARVSSPQSVKTHPGDRLLAYCIKNHHWSVFEMASFTVLIQTTRAISPQLLRHRSFTFQEFSQRYSPVGRLGASVIPQLRRQDPTNRQNSIDDLDPKMVFFLQAKIAGLFEHVEEMYKELLGLGVAKECARAVLPLNSPTQLFMRGSVRSWIHYIQLREANGTQKEHADIAKKVKAIFVELLPVCAKALGWLEPAP